MTHFRIVRIDIEAAEKMSDAITAAMNRLGTPPWSVIAMTYAGDELFLLVGR